MGARGGRIASQRVVERVRQFELGAQGVERRRDRERAGQDLPRERGVAAVVGDVERREQESLAETRHGVARSQALRRVEAKVEGTASALTSSQEAHHEVACAPSESKDG